jgi:hypothetical protein
MMGEVAMFHCEILIDTVSFISCQTIPNLM